MPLVKNGSGGFYVDPPTVDLRKTKMKPQELLTFQLHWAFSEDRKIYRLGQYFNRLYKTEDAYLDMIKSDDDALYFIKTKYVMR